MTELQPSALLEPGAATTGSISSTPTSIAVGELPGADSTSALGLLGPHSWIRFPSTLPTYPALLPAQQENTGLPPSKQSRSPSRKPPAGETQCLCLARPFLPLPRAVDYLSFQQRQAKFWGSLLNKAVPRQTLCMHMRVCVTGCVVGERYWRVCETPWAVNKLGEYNIV